MEKLPIKFYEFISNINYYLELRDSILLNAQGYESYLIESLVNELAFIYMSTDVNSSISPSSLSELRDIFEDLVKINPIKYNYLRRVNIDFLREEWLLTHEQFLDWIAINFMGKNKLFIIKREK